MSLHPRKDAKSVHWAEYEWVRGKVIRERADGRLIFRTEDGAEIAVTADQLSPNRKVAKVPAWLAQDFREPA